MAVMGLGNPGETYSNNRHNFGFMVIDHLCESKNLAFRSGGKSYLWCEDQMSRNKQNQTVLLSKPITFMNNSGVAARQIIKECNLSPEKLLVVYDDLDLPLGRIRLRKNGSPGGHNGIKSITDHLQTQDFPRLRLGIGPQTPGIPSEDFVLEDFTKSEQLIVKKISEISETIIRDLPFTEIEFLMNKFNNIDFSTNTGEA